jgi:hypothetical protein
MVFLGSNEVKISKIFGVLFNFNIAWRFCFSFSCLACQLLTHLKNNIKTVLKTQIKNVDEGHKYRTIYLENIKKETI